MASLLRKNAGKRVLAFPSIATLALPLALMLVALAVRLVHLGAASLWLDEAISWSVASTPWADLLAGLEEPHPPLYYAFLKLWMHLGTSEAMLRLPTAVVGVVDVALVWALARRWGGSTAGMVAAALVALSPLHVWYAREARMYEFVAAAGAGSTLLLACWWSAPRPVARALWLGAYVLAALAGLYLNYTMALVVAVQAIAVVGAGRWRRTGAFLLALLAVAAGYLPWLPVAAAHLTMVRGTHFRAYAGRLAELTGIALTGDHLLIVLGVVPALAILLAAFLGRPIWGRLRQMATGPAGVAALAVVPLALLILFGDIPRALTVKRQMLPLVPPAIALGAVAIAGHARWRPMLAGLVLLGLPGVWLAIAGHDLEPWRAAAAVVEAEARPDDLVLVHVGYAEPAFRYYYRGTAPVRSAAVEPAGRIWLVLSRWAGPADPFGQWFGGHWRLVGTAEVPPLAVRLYERRAE